MLQQFRVEYFLHNRNTLFIPSGRHFGFVLMSSAEDAEKAIAALQNFSLRGKSLKLQYAHKDQEIKKREENQARRKIRKMRYLENR